MQINSISPLNYTSTKMQEKKDRTVLYTGLCSVPACALTGGTIQKKYDKNLVEKISAERVSLYKKNVESSTKISTLTGKFSSLVDKARTLGTELKYAKEMLSNMTYRESQLRLDLQQAFNFLSQAVSEGEKRAMPNCLMFIGDNDSLCERLARWMAKDGNANFLYADRYNMPDVIYQAVEELKSDKNWRLMYVKDMDIVINPSITEDCVIEGMKDYMSSFVRDFKTTAIFQAKNPAELDSIALQAHRVAKKFDISNINEDRFFKLEDIIEKLDPILKESKEIYATLENLQAENEINRLKIKEFDNKIESLFLNRKKRICISALAGIIIAGIITIVVKIIKERTKNVNTN